MQGDMLTFSSTDTTEKEDRIALSYSLEMLNILSHGSGFPDHALVLKREFIIMPLCK